MHRQQRAKKFSNELVKNTTCLLIQELATCRMPQPVVVCLVTLAGEHPPALGTCTMAVQHGRGLVLIGLRPQRGIIRHLLPRGVVAWVLGVRDWAASLWLTQPNNNSTKFLKLCLGA